MLFYSTNKHSPKVNFKDATIQGLAPDGGVYFPERIPVFSSPFINKIEQLSNFEIAFTVISPYINKIIPDHDLHQIINETINFDFPLVRINEDVCSLELFHGPTLAFKDVGARFMSRCLGFFRKDESRKVTVLVATSGDTGGAVADGFYNVEGVDVVILYPSGKVSKIQELQLTTHGRNINAIEIKGTFDDCQHLVKQAFNDIDLNEKLFLTSANSINIARWLPQQFYYLFAYKQWKNKGQLPVISVPSGNFGNVCAGILAHLSGLPIRRFIASCNSNNVVPCYMDTGNFISKPSIITLSNAMDVGNPSNFVRILELFNNQYILLKEVLSSFSFNDHQTKEAIKLLYRDYHYLADPHGAVGYLGLQKYLSSHPGSKGVFLETAHPIKFPNVVEEVTGQKLKIPVLINKLFELESKKTTMDVNYNDFKNYLTSLK